MKSPLAAFAPVLLSLATACVSSAALGAEAKATFKPDAARGQQLAAACGACHMSDGTRGQVANPILQGQQADYLVKQLGEFKAGKRKNPIMMGMATPLAEDDMKHIAAFYASKPVVAGTSANKESAALGALIYRGGIAARQIPACAGCHSPTGSGMPAQYPRVAGQHAEYAQAQLVAFRSGERANSAQMTTIAAKLSDREIKAVADYVAGLR